MPNAFVVCLSDVVSPAVFPVVPVPDLCSYPQSRFPQARTFCRRPPDRCAVVRIQAVFALYLGFAERFPAFWKIQPEKSDFADLPVLAYSHSVSLAGLLLRLWVWSNSAGILLTGTIAAAACPNTGASFDLMKDGASV